MRNWLARTQLKQRINKKYKIFRNYEEQQDRRTREIV